MKENWNEYLEQLMSNVGDFAKESPDVVKGLMVIDSAASKTAHLEPKIHELIALAVAVTTRCDGCIVAHTKKAIEQGASKQEIAEALGVAVALNAGAALTYSARAMEVHNQLKSSIGNNSYQI